MIEVKIECKRCRSVEISNLLIVFVLAIIQYEWTPSMKNDPKKLLRKKIEDIKVFNH